MDLKSSFVAIFSILVNPKDVLRHLPENKILFVGFIIPLVVGTERALRKGLLETLGIPQAMLIILLTLALLYPLVTLVLKLIVGLFGRRITFVSCLNVVMYSQAPRFITALALWGIAQGHSISTLLVLPSFILGLVSIFYSVYLLITGLSLKSYKLQAK